MLHEELEEDIKRFYFDKYDLNETNILSIVLCGSWAVGFQLPLSDIDLTIVVSDLDAFGVSDFDFVVDYISGYRVEAGIVTISSYRNLISNIQKNGDRVREHYPADKLVHYIPLYQKNVARELHSGFDLHRFTNDIVLKKQTHILAVFEDIMSALSGSRYELVVLWGRRLINLAVDGMLASRGDHFDRPKWRSERLKVELGKDHELVNIYMDLVLSGPSLNKNSVDSWIKICFAACCWVQMNAFFGCSEVPKFETHRVESDVEYNKGILVKLEGKYVICQHRYMVVTDECIARLYLDKAIQSLKKV